LYTLEKLHCWYSLIDISEEVRGLNLIAVGDFNTILNNKEKIGGNIVWDPCRELMEDFTSSWDLVDIKPAKGTVMWSNNRTGSAHIG
jgi:hypothetical protein